MSLAAVSGDEDPLAGLRPVSRGAPLIWTSGALDGLGRVYLFWAEKNEDAAIKALDAINEGTLLLERFPEAGRPAEDLEPEHRELLIPFGGSGFVLLYRIENAVVYILALRHQREAGY